MNNNQSFPLGESAPPPRRFETNPPDHILVVEDDVLIQQLNAEVLTCSGYAVDVAVDGAAAWKALGADSYDLMITDNNMPKLTGVELLKKLHAARMDMPVIMATGALPQHEFNRHPWLQPAATLLKPYTMDDLLRTVKKVLREAESTTEGLQRFMARGTKDNQTSPAGPPTVSASSGPTNALHRILVVDEDRDLRQLYAEALAGPSCAVDGAADGAAAWEALQSNCYNLLITEHDMPKLTGVQLLRKLRAAHMDLPVVMVAGRLPTDELDRDPWLQFAGTLVKPFAVDVLVDTVNNILRANASPREQTIPPANWRSQPSVGALRPG